MTAHSAFSQTLDDFFHDKGTADLLDAAHPSNDYLHGRHDIYADYVDVSLTSKDNVLGGKVYTDLRVVRGTGDLYFSDIIVLKDTDPFAKPFEALEAEIEMLRQAIKAMDQETYDKMRRSVQDAFNTDIEHWNGKMWTVFGLNIEYYQYMLNGK